MSVELRMPAASVLPPRVSRSQARNSAIAEVEVPLMAFAASLAFGGLYIGLVKLIGVTEIDALLQSLLGLLRRFLPGMAR